MRTCRSKAAAAAEWRVWQLNGLPSARRKAEAVLIIRQEVEAVVQRGKDGPKGPSYKPTILRHQGGLILAHHVHTSSETVALELTLGQPGRCLEHRRSGCCWMRDTTAWQY